MCNSKLIREGNWTHKIYLSLLKVQLATTMCVRPLTLRNSTCQVSAIVRWLHLRFNLKVRQWLRSRLRIWLHQRHRWVFKRSWPIQPCSHTCLASPNTKAWPYQLVICMLCRLIWLTLLKWMLWWQIRARMLLKTYFSTTELIIVVYLILRESNMLKTR